MTTREMRVDDFRVAPPRYPAGGSEAPEPGQPPPPARAPRATGLSFEDWPSEEAAPRGRRWLLGAAVVPWLVLVAILLGRGAPDGAPPKAAPSDPAPTADPAAPTPSSNATEPAGLEEGAPYAAVLSSGARTRLEADAAAGVALAVVRAHLSGLPTPLRLDGVPPAVDADAIYVEHVAVEAIDHPGADLAVVTALAVVLPWDGRGYGDAELRRLAVPVRFVDGEARPAGAPWPLPASLAAPSEPEAEPVDDAQAAVAAERALQDAGYDEVSIVWLARTDSWAWIAEIDAIAPGETEPRRQQVWLRPHLDGLAVAGWLPATPEPEASKTPNEQDVE